MRSEPVLVTGATGYVGGRLVPLLLDSGCKVRVMGRSMAFYLVHSMTSRNKDFAEADRRAAIEPLNL